jgi:23S rRNA (uracil1939-C5)-methyltransferase
MKLRIEKMVYGGAGLAHEEAGKALFVPFTLPDEVVEARVVEERGGFGEAALVQVVEGSADRVGPGCVHFGDCGGCHYQHGSYGAQLDIKRGILVETLERAGLVELPAVRVHGSGEAWKYRNRIRLRVAEVDGELRVGYLRRGSAEFLPVRMCPIAAPLLWRAAEALLTVGVDVVGSKWVRVAIEVEFFAAADESLLQMVLFVEKEPGKGFEAMCLKMQELVPQLVGAGVMVLGPKRQMRAGASWGAEGLSYEVVGEKYWVGRGSFFQVNRWLLPELVGLVTGGRKGLIAWDLYAGVGLFSRALAKNFSEVVAVEAAGGDLTKSF